MDTEKTPPIWVMTANIAGQTWMKWEERKHVAAQVLGASPAHLIGFQEFGSEPDSWKTLEPHLPHMSLYRGEKAGDIFINSIAVDSRRFTTLDSGTFWLTADGKYGRGWDGGERGASWVILRDHERSDYQPNTFLHINFHLDYKGVDARIEGIKAIIRFADVMAKGGNIPVILTADSNVSVASPNKRWGTADMSKPYYLLTKAGFVDTWVEAHTIPGELSPPISNRPQTYHGFMGEDYRGDEWGTYDTEWVFVRGFKTLRALLVRDSVSGVYPSDHYPMMARVEWMDN